MISSVDFLLAALRTTRRQLPEPNIYRLDPEYRYQGAVRPGADSSIRGVAL